MTPSDADVEAWFKAWRARADSLTVETWPIHERRDAVDLLRVQTLDLADALGVLDRLQIPEHYEHPLLLPAELHQLAIATRRLCDAVVRAAQLVEERTATLTRLENQP